MSSERPMPTSFSELEDPALTYKPISAMAVVSLLLGIAALGAFFAWILWIVPPIAILVAGPTSRRLEQAREEYAGQFIAKLGLLLAVVALAGAPSIYYTKRFILGREARVVADSFVDLILENKLKQAFAHTVRPDMVQATGGDLDKILDRAGKDRYHMFLTQQTVGLFGGKGADAQVTHMGYIYHGADMGIERVLHSYVVATYDAQGNRKDAFSFVVLVAGGVSPDWTGRKWYVEMSEAVPYDASNKWQPAARSG